MDTRMFMDSLMRFLYSAPLVVAVVIVLLAIVLPLVGRRLRRRRAEPLLPDIGEPGAPMAQEFPLRIPELLSPEMGGLLSAIEVPPAAPDTREAPPLFRPPEPEPAPRPLEPRQVVPPPEAPRWRMRPEEVRSHTFRRRLRGYDPREVYEYLVAVSDELGALQRRILELRQEGQGLREELGRWRDQAGQAQNTLATAQKLAEEMMAMAREEAAREAERIGRGASERLIQLQQEMGRLEQDRSRVREELRRDAHALAATLRDLEADSILLTRVRAPRPPAGEPQAPAPP